MGRKVFVSYKYKDNSVKELPGTIGFTTPHDYVRYIEQYVLQDDVFKGEKEDEDLSSYTDDYIMNHLKNKIWDSSITVLLISPNMKTPGKPDRLQWIPWELSYSLRITKRKNRTSQRNSIVAVVLPDRLGGYNYFDIYNTFTILRDNIINGYIYLTNWGDFREHSEYCFSEADNKLNSLHSVKMTINL